MEYRPYHDARKFWVAAESLVLQREAENNLLIGNALRLIGDGETFFFTLTDQPLMFTVVEGEAVVAAGLMTPPFNLVLTSAPPEVVEFIAAQLARQQLALPGIIAPMSSAEVFSHAWARLVGRLSTLTKTLRAYQLDQVIPVQGVSGCCAEAADDNIETLVRWQSDFSALTGQGHTDAAENIRRRLEAHSLVVWRNPAPVAMAGFSGFTPNGARVGAVYTPPEERCKGYASALVAALSQRLLDNGRQFCFLFTDLANPTSNSIYQKIGYRPVCDYATYHFAQGE